MDSISLEPVLMHRTSYWTPTAVNGRARTIDDTSETSAAIAVNAM
jgi:hypothetical protein